MKKTFVLYGKQIGILTAVCLFGFIGMRLIRAHQIQHRAEVVGWDLHVPLFDMSEWEQLVAESERLKRTAESVERKYDVVLPHPYADWWLTPLPEWFQEMSRTGMDLSSFDLSNVDMYTWVRIRPFLHQKNIPPGTFQMGCTDEQASECHDWEKPVHSVTISKEFYMMQSEVTQALYELVMGTNPSLHQSDNQPVEQVTWYDAVTFANRLSELDGLQPCYAINGKNVEWIDVNCKGWRLPTEAEWEYAARAGQQNKFSGSGRLESVGWYYANSNHKPHDVCEKFPNGFGLCDMSGNVWEWVWDSYGEYNALNQTDPTGSTEGTKRILRGGSWRHYERNSRVSIRYYISPGYGNQSWGFRLVRST